MTTDDYTEQPPTSVGTTTTVEQLPPGRREHPPTGNDFEFVIALALVLVLLGLVIAAMLRSTRLRVKR
jgi:hypothetical protein